MVDIVVLPMGLQTPSIPSVPSLTPLLGTLYSVQWLVANIHLSICKALKDPLRRQPYQAPFSMHFLASTIVSGFGDVYGMDPQVGNSLVGAGSSVGQHVEERKSTHSYPLVQSLVPSGSRTST